MVLSARGRTFGECGIIAFCEKMDDFAQWRLKLSNFDNKLMRRSMLIVYGLASTISRESDLGQACWTQNDEDLVQHTLNPSFTSKVGAFGNHKVK
jgi:hypothetical protein